MKTDFIQTFIPVTIIALVLFCGFSVAVVRAQTPAIGTQPYTVLAPLPGTTSNCTGSDSGAEYDCTTTFQTYLPAIFNLSIGIAAALAFVMISYGGFELMTTDSIQGKMDGRKKVTDAVYGLILVIGAYAILYTINPQLLNFNLNIGTPNYGSLPSGGVTSGGGGGTGGTGSGNLSGNAPILTQAAADMLTTNAQMQSYFSQASNNNISVNNVCASGQTSGCTDVSDIELDTINGVVGLQSKCGCQLTITGGDEAGHSATGGHSQGTALDVVDTQDSTLDTTIKQNATLTSQNADGSCSVYTDGSGNTYLYEKTGDKCGGPVASTGTHWHINYK